MSDETVGIAIGILAFVIALAGIVLPVSEDTSEGISGCKVMLSANQVVLAGGWRTIENVTTHAFTAGEDGRYLVNCLVMLNPIPDQAWTGLRVWNGTGSVIEHYVYISSSGSVTSCMYTAGVLELSEGDSFVLQVYHPVGGTVNVLGGWGGSRTCLTVLCLS